MKLLVGGTKGGTGKSTLAVNLAAWRAQQGRDVLLVDTDTRQGSTKLWWNLRVKNNTEPSITLISLDGDELQQSIRMQAGRYDDVVIDAGGYDSVELRSAMMIADMMLTPARPGIFDFQALAILDRLVADARILNPSIESRLLLNMMPSHPRATDAETMLESVSALNLIRPLEPMIKSRRAFYDAAAKGCAVMEISPSDPKAVAEINEVATEVFNGR